MPKINRYVDISTVDREAKKDYIDRHSAFICCADAAKAGQKTFQVVPSGKKLELTAVSYCTKHGLWECDPVEVTVED